VKNWSVWPHKRKKRANCTIVCGHTIGSYAFIGAGAVVTKDVPDHALMVGNPAKNIGNVCICGERLPDSLKCSSCGKRYIEGKEGLKVFNIEHRT
jgi:UDP-2-acetamido-3-amino-2,3-dideoxy-glucuronate N-acetyltransferase